MFGLRLHAYKENKTQAVFLWFHNTYIHPNKLHLQHMNFIHSYVGMLQWHNSQNDKNNPLIFGNSFLRHLLWIGLVVAVPVKDADVTRATCPISVKEECCLTPFIVGSSLSIQETLGQADWAKTSSNYKIIASHLTLQGTMACL